MIRTRCPHCNKLLGVVDSAAGMITTCPGCKQKFRAPGAKAAAPPTAPPQPPATEDFPEVELVEDGAEVVPPRKAATPGKRPPPRKAAPDADVAARDDEGEAPARKGDRGQKKGKRAKAEQKAGRAWRNRLMGAVGVAAGLFLIWFGMTHPEILNVTAQAKAFNPSLEAVPRFVTIGFGVILVLVGGFYLVIDLFRE